MKRAILVAALLTTSVIGLGAQSDSTTRSTAAIRKSFASEKITVANSAIGFTAATINPTVTAGDTEVTRANAAVCSLETADIRFLTSGTPTSSTGIYLAAGSTVTIYGYNDISSFLAIRISSTSGVLNCVYQR